MNNLTSRAIHRSELSPALIAEMFTVFIENFDLSSLEIFQRDLSGKDWIILLHDEHNHVQGFSTLALYKTDYCGQCISVVYSGDTIIRRAYWGTPELPKRWIHTVLEKSADMAQPVYWLLITSGYKTYRFLTVFYKEFYPCHDRLTPPEIQSLMDYLAKQRFGNEYHRDLGIVRFQNGATPLRDGVAEVTDERLHDPRVAHYIKINPHHDQGDELVCITRIHPDNFTPAGRRMAR
jgi:hypothetical protein